MVKILLEHGQNLTNQPTIICIKCNKCLFKTSNKKIDVASITHAAQAHNGPDLRKISIVNS